MKRKEIIEALQAEDFTKYYEKANEICLRTKGDVVSLRAIIEFSNICNRQCAYCGLNVDNEKVERYMMTEEEIVSTAKEAIEAGYRTIILQSGENTGITLEQLLNVVGSIKAIDKDVAITISAGELNEEWLKALKEKGADRYLLKHETADPILYKKLHPDSSLGERIKALKTIKQLGLETGSGFMIGLPGATVETTADDLLLLKELGCHMAGIGPFIASPDTPLKGRKDGDVELTKRAVAIARILLPDANLPVTTSLGVLNGEERKKAFSCGANVLMRKVTPEEYKDKYSIYPAKIPPTNIEKDRKDIIEMLKEIGKKGE